MKIRGVPSDSGSLLLPKSFEPRCPAVPRQQPHLTCTFETLHLCAWQQDSYRHAASRMLH